MTNCVEWAGHPLSIETEKVYEIFPSKTEGDWYQWLHGLRRRSAAARLLGLRIRIPLVAWMSACCECCVLSGRRLRDGPITHPEESYRVCLCVSLSVIRCNNNPRHLQWVGRRGQTKKGGKKEPKRTGRNPDRRMIKSDSNINPYPTAFPYGNGMVLHFYQQQESSTTKTVHKVINKRLKTYV